MTDTPRRTRHPLLEWTSARVRSFWEYESHFPERYFAFHRGDAIVSRFRRDLRGCETILDYGCGGGHLLDRLLARGYRAAGSDLSTDAVRNVANAFGGREHFLGAWTPSQLLERGNRFDAVFVVEVVEHLSDDLLAGMLSDLKRLVQPSGVILLTTPNQERLEKKQVFCPACEQVFHRWGHVRSWSDETLRAALEAAGFEVVRSFTTDFGLSLRKNFPKALALGLFQLLPGRKRPHLAVVCRPRSGQGSSSSW